MGIRGSSEVCFWALNGKSAMKHNKKTEKGRNKRIDLLRPHISNIEMCIRDSPKGIKIPNSEMAQLNLVPADFHGDWNYSLLPRDN